MYVKKITIVCLVLFSGVVFGQKSMTDSTHLIDEVVIRSTRLQDFSVGSSVQKIGAISLQLFSSYSFADLLATKSLVLINSYGVGGLSNPSIRGGGASHTAVIWNGVNIQSPMHGGVNLAMIPAGLADNVSIQYGGSGTLFGSGAVSGIIHFGDNNLFNIDDKFEYSIAYGSFNTKNAMVGFKLGNEKIATSFKYLINLADNDFKYEREDGSIVEQTNAGLKQHSFISETQIRTSNKSMLKMTAWYQTYNKDIQTQLSAVTPSEANEKNENLRMAFRWNYAKRKYSLNVKSVYLLEKINFLDPSYMTEESENKAQSSINEFEVKFVINDKQLLISGLNYTHEKAESKNYIESVTRNILSAFVSYKIQNLFDRITLVNSIRQEQVDSEFNPLVFSSGLNAKIVEHIAFVANISRTYNNPGLNDLYWAPGPWTAGNPDLKAEYGWSSDLGLIETFKLGSIDVNLKQNIFTNNINDWIIWLPNEEFVWMPENKKYGKSSGFDFHLNASLNLGVSKINLQGLYTHTNSVFEELENNIMVEKEFIYIPKNQYALSLNYQSKNWGLYLSQNYFDERLYNLNEDPLKEFSIYNVVFNYDILFKAQKLSASFHINNIFDNDYQVIYDYAMPGRNFKFSLNYTFK